MRKHLFGSEAHQRYHLPHREERSMKVVHMNRIAPYVGRNEKKGVACEPSGTYERQGQRK